MPKIDYDATTDKILDEIGTNHRLTEDDFERLALACLDQAGYSVRQVNRIRQILDGVV